jgi:hypothetical protein
LDNDPLNIFPHPSFNERAERFHNSYSLVNLIGVGDEAYSKRSLKGYTTRICLYCGKDGQETSFKTLAHLVPQLIGNSNLYSDFECDACNQRFSELEDDLAAFLGVSRSIVGLGNERRTVGFTARRLRAKSRSFMGENILIVAPEDIETVDGTSTIRYTKNPFSPFSVYKAMLKSAISLLGPRYVSEFYKTALDLLAGRACLEKGLAMIGYQLTFKTNLPFHAFHFKKRNSFDKIPTDILLFHFQNHMISLPMPMHEDDKKMHDSDFSIIAPPPYFTNIDNMRTALPTGYVRDFSSRGLITGEEETLVLKIDDSALQNIAAFNGKTGQVEEKKFGEHPTKYLILVKEATQVDAKALHAFIESQMEPQS